MTYKVGDRIKIVRVADKWRGNSEYDTFLSMVGQSHRVREIGNGAVHLDINKAYVWEFDEIELDKNYYVTEILKDL